MTTNQDEEDIGQLSSCSQHNVRCLDVREVPTADEHSDVLGPDAHAILLNDGQIWLIKLIEFLVELYDAGLIQLGAVGRDKIPDAIGVAQTKNAV